ncbi:MAG: SulP family inorganic anion transporter [Candidatus Nanopelagicales bacterium]
MRIAPARDLQSGLTVGVVALPLALAFGITSGLGAAAGLVTAIVAGVVAAVFGGSNVQVSGPTGAMTVVLVPIVAAYGANGVLVVGIMAGLLLLVMAFAGLGRYIRFVPLPVIEGFTLGIAVIIALQQVPAALGQEGGGEQVVLSAIDDLWAWLSAPQWPPLLLTMGTVVVILGAARLRVRPAVPVALIAVVAATLLVQVADIPVAAIGTLPPAIPAPHLPDFRWSDLRVLAAPALAVAALAALESLLSATVADAMSVSGRHDPDRELFGQGLANIASPLFGGIPATAAIARTAVNVRTGAVSRLAALVHALVLVLVVVALGTVVALIPLAVLAGVLIATAARMVEVSSLRVLLRASRSDAIVLIVTFVATVALDLATAVILGIVVAGATALRQVARSTSLTEMPLSDAADSHTASERALLDEHIVAYRLDGPLFFGGAHSALMELAEITDTRVVILRMSHMSTLDATGAAVLSDTIRGLEARGTTVLVSGLPQRFLPQLEATGIIDDLRTNNHLFDSTPAAIAHARRHVRRDNHHHGQRAVGDLP